jgi:hypothetical protein
VRESVESTPRLDFDQAEITVNIAVEKDGSIKIIFGAEVTEENAQTVKLEFEPSVALGQLDHPLLETEHARTYERGGDGHMFG